MKKNFLPDDRVGGIDYYPARLITNRKRWHITFSVRHKGKMTQYNRSYNLNRIKSIPERRKAAHKIILLINEHLPSGYPVLYDRLYTIDEESITTVKDAIERALSLKKSKGKKTYQGYKSIAKAFTEWAKKCKYLKRDVQKFTKKHAYQFLDDITISAKLSNKTHNNYIIAMRSMWNGLVEREIIAVNPFSKMQKRPEEKKMRRALNQTEKHILIKTIKQRDNKLYLAVILQYYCNIRPVELVRLQVGHFHIEKGYIFLPASISRKGKKDRMATIPDEILNFLRSFNLHLYPNTWYVFGKRTLISADSVETPNTLRYKHKAIVDELKEYGILPDDNSIQFYSWKDTGVVDYNRTGVPLVDVSKQCGHSDVSTTMKYFSPEERLILSVKYVNLGLIRE